MAGLGWIVTVLPCVSVPLRHGLGFPRSQFRSLKLGLRVGKVLILGVFRGRVLRE
jgi:hypothetical protein